MSTHLTPVEVAEHMMGGIEAVAGICLLNRKTAYLWRRPSNARDAGDLPSTRVQRRLLAHCAAKGLPMQPEWLIWGAPREEVEAAMAAYVAPTRPAQERAA